MRRTALLLAALPLAAWAPAHAQASLSDPTRPPQVTALSAQAGVARAPGHRLQSVLISPNRRLAVIDGRTVAQGATLDGATLVQVAETHVVLRQGGETKTLELTPGVAKKKGKP